MPTPEPPAERDLDRSLLSAVLAGVIVLSAMSGIIDASSYQRFGVFVANQTGNLVIVALSLVSGEDSAQRDGSLVAVLSFTIGVFLAMYFRRFLERRLPGSRVQVMMIALEALLIAIVAIGSVVFPPEQGTYTGIALLSLSQAVQALVLTRIAGVTVTTVVINTALVQSANSLGRGLHLAAIVALGTPVGYLAGAFIGAILLTISTTLPLFAALALGIVAMSFGPAMRRRGVTIE